MLNSIADLFVLTASAASIYCCSKWQTNHWEPIAPTKKCLFTFALSMKVLHPVCFDFYQQSRFVTIMLAKWFIVWICFTIFFCHCPACLQRRLFAQISSYLMNDACQRYALFIFGGWVSAQWTASQFVYIQMKNFPYCFRSYKKLRARNENSKNEHERWYWRVTN